KVFVLACSSNRLIFLAFVFAHSMDAIHKTRKQWEENRRKAIRRIREIAGELDRWNTNDKVTSSGVGLIGGGLMLASFLFPPLLIPGIVTSVVGAGGKIGMSIKHMAVVKGLVAEAQALCEESARMLSKFLDQADEVLKVSSGASIASVATNGLRATVWTLRNTFVRFAGDKSLKALLPTAAVGPIKWIAGATAGIGMAIDTFMIISSAKSLAKYDDSIF
ncbi:hypothetical protein PMAYCL1PPCAC_04589, partial [Pristionchus mayeri]